MDDVYHHEQLTRQARVQAAKMRSAVKLLLSKHRRMTLQLAVTYLNICMNEGLSVSDLAERCGLSASTMSRHLQDLGCVNRHEEKGLELVAMTQRTHGDRRVYQVILSETGRDLARQMIAAIRPRGRPAPLGLDKSAARENHPSVPTVEGMAHGGNYDS